jgi:hypothetical protein
LKQTRTKEQFTKPVKKRNFRKKIEEVKKKIEQLN